ncbi:unnamed protein product [Peronospora destructor]|nr:unnamed protein product [Peronospora destructor]
MELSLLYSNIIIQLDSKPKLDVDTLRNLVVPLLVDGEQFDAPGASTGLLFLEAFPLLEDKGSRDTTVIVQKDAFITLLLQLQPLWRSFSASLLARLCQKVFDAVCTQQSHALSEEGGETYFSSFSGDQEKRTFKQNEVEMTLLWIKFMISSDYRERVKLQIGPIHDLWRCGAEMLVLAENLQPGDVVKGREELFERLLAALASESAIGWTQLPAWAESPIGLRYCYTSYQSNNQSQVLEFSLDDDSLTRNSTTFVTSDDEEEEEIYETDADDVMDALMEDLDAAYDTTLQQILDLQATIARDGLRQGGNAIVLPKQELQRIQKEIEIW